MHLLFCQQWGQCIPENWLDLINGRTAETAQMTSAHHLCVFSSGGQCSNTLGCVQTTKQYQHSLSKDSLLFASVMLLVMLIFTHTVWVSTSESTYLINESPDAGEHMFKGSFWLADFEEGQVNIKHLLHQWIVTFTVQQLILSHIHTHTHENTNKPILNFK